MGEKPREEILIQPEFSIFEFGDGYIGLVQGAIVNEDAEGIKVIELTLKPSELLRKRYDIKSSELDGNGNINIKVKQDDVIILNPYDDANRKWLYMKNYLHEDTEISKFSQNLRESLEKAEKRINVAEGQLIWYLEQLQLATSNPVEFISQGFEIFERISDKMVDIGKTKKEKEDGGK